MFGLIIVRCFSDVVLNGKIFLFLIKIIDLWVKWCVNFWCVGLLIVDLGLESVLLVLSLFVWVVIVKSCFILLKMMVLEIWFFFMVLSNFLLNVWVGLGIFRFSLFMVFLIVLSVVF